MSHDHIGIPKFIENGFSIKGKVYCYNLIQKKAYQISIDRLGVQKEYYEKDVENELLANGIELQFSLFYNDFCGTTNIDFMIEMLNDNKQLVTQFFSFMFSRAKKTLETINKESLTSKIIGNINHSELLRIQTIINTNPLQIIGDNYNFYPLVNFSDHHFINNSIGFGSLINKNKEISIVIPLNKRVAILISSSEDLKDCEMYYIGPKESTKADIINKGICRMEVEYGNGFIFGENKEIIEPLINYISNWKMKEKN